MRAVFSIVSLLVVVAIVGVLAARQFRAVGQAVPKAAQQAGVAGAAPASGNLREQSRQIQQQVANDVAKALEQGAARKPGAEE